MVDDDRCIPFREQYQYRVDREHGDRGVRRRDQRDLKGSHFAYSDLGFPKDHRSVHCKVSIRSRGLSVLTRTNWFRLFKVDDQDVLCRKRNGALTFIVERWLR